MLQYLQFMALTMCVFLIQIKVWLFKIVLSLRSVKGSLKLYFLRPQYLSKLFQSQLFEGAPLLKMEFKFSFLLISCLSSDNSISNNICPLFIDSKFIHLSLRSFIFSYSDLNRFVEIFLEHRESKSKTSQYGIHRSTLL